VIVFLALLAAGGLVAYGTGRALGNVADFAEEYFPFFVIGAIFTFPIWLARAFFSSDSAVVVLSAYCAASLVGVAAAAIAALVGYSFTSGEPGLGGYRSKPTSWIGLPFVLLLAAIPTFMITGVLALGAAWLGWLVADPLLPQLESHSTAIQVVFVGLDISGLIVGGVRGVLLGSHQ
jgi:hypothetical protein